MLDTFRWPELLEYKSLPMIYGEMPLILQVEWSRMV